MISLHIRLVLRPDYRDRIDYTYIMEKSKSV